MAKIKILGIGNEEEFNYIIVEKSRDFFKFLEEWLDKSLPEAKIEDIAFQEGDKKNNYEMKPKIVSKYNDMHEDYRGKGIRIDAFFGKKKVFITIYTSLGNRKKLMDNLERYGKFVKVRKY